MIKAKWREGFGGFYDADAQIVASELGDIGDAPTPNEIVDKARDEGTELHKCFTWDNDEASEKWRLQEARQLLYRLVTVEEQVPEDRPEVRMYYKTKPNEGYKRTEVIIQKQDEYKALLTRAYAELRAFKEKYKCLKELQEIFDLIK